jgi:hypothetical protein
VAVTVHVVPKAFDDAGPGGRIRHLGELAGYNEFEALGRLTFLWRHCRKARSQVVNPDTIRGYLGHNGDQHLITAGLGEPNGEGVRVRGLREVMQLSERRADVGRLGGIAKAEKATETVAIAKQELSNCQPNAKQKLDVESSSDLFSEISSLSGASSEIPRDLKQQGKGQAKRPNRKPETEYPEGFAPNQLHRTFAAENQLDVNFEAGRFADHHRSKGSLFRDWDMAFRTWLKNQVAWRKPGSVTPPRGGESSGTRHL